MVVKSEVDYGMKSLSCVYYFMSYSFDLSIMHKKNFKEWRLGELGCNNGVPGNERMKDHLFGG